jgi:glycosyltransferase involved in cell wall biosynthesis
MEKDKIKYSIIYDDEIFVRQKHGGVSRIFFELISKIKSSSNWIVNIYNFYSENPLLIKLNISQVHPFLKSLNFPLKNKLIRAVSLNCTKYKINKAIKEASNRCIFHPTFYNDYYLNSLKNNTHVKLVFTVHDLIHEMYPTSKAYKEIAEYKRKNLEVADLIITVSENTKKDLIRFYPFVNESKVYVIHLAESVSNVNPQYIDNLPKEYLLFVGERAGYKNFNVLLEAFYLIHKKYDSLHLVIAGGQSYDRHEHKKIKEYGLSNRIIKLSVNDSQLNYLYTNAKAFVFPSKYEGFGIPTLEAFGCGTPLITSGGGSIKEVAKDCCLYFDPNNSTDLANTIELILNDHAVRDNLIRKGKERAQLFSWNKHVNETMRLYETLYSDGFK